RDVPQVFEQLTEEMAGAVVIMVSGKVQIHTSRQDILRPDSGIDTFQVHQAPHHESCADQQPECYSHFSGHQCVSESLMACRRGCASAALHQHTREIAARNKGRYRAKYNSSTDGDDTCKEEYPSVDLNLRCTRRELRCKSNQHVETRIRENEA